VGEDRFVNRVNELLLAAAEERPVRPVTDEQAACFEHVEQLRDSGGWAEQYGRLAAHQPDLVDLLRTVEQAVAAQRQESDKQKRNAAKWEVRKQVRATLKRLVGPDSTIDDPLLRLRTAHELAMNYLDVTFILDEEGI
jgi:hypothetical protein